MPERSNSTETGDENREPALHIVKTLQSRGFKAFWAGGCVRDMIMGITPTDYDIATNACPDDVKKIFARTVPVGEKFGVMLVIEKGAPFEVATFRGEGQYRNGRRPDVIHFTDEEEDVKRRDFTINGLLYDPTSEHVIDFVKGRDDIEAKLIRTIGDPWLRFSEDNLRILRAIRLAAALGFDIERNTREVIEKKSGEILNISWERIREETLKILLGPSPRYGFELMHETGILGRILPEVENMAGVDQPPEFHPEGDVFTHTMLMLDIMDKPSVELALAVLLHDIGKPETFEIADRIRFNNHDVIGAELTEKLLRRLRVSNKTVKRVASLVEHHLKFMNVKSMRKSKLKRFIKDPYFTEHLELHRLDCLASHKDLSIWNFCVDKMKEYESEVIPPPPLVKGHDLITLGFKPGPVFSEILSFIQDLQIEGRVTTKEEALELIIENFAEKKRKKLDEQESE